MLEGWPRPMLEEGSVAVSEGYESTSNKVVRQPDDRVGELDRQFGGKTLGGTWVRHSPEQPCE